jgi:hypothetical protein
MVSVRGRRRLVKRLPVGLRFLGPSVPRLPSLTLLLGSLLNALRPKFFYHPRPPRSAPCALNLSIIFGANSTIAIPTSVVIQPQTIIEATHGFRPGPAEAR